MVVGALSWSVICPLAATACPSSRTCVAADVFHTTVAVPSLPTLTANLLIAGSVGEAVAAAAGAVAVTLGSAVAVGCAPLTSRDRLARRGTISHPSRSSNSAMNEARASM